MLTFFFWTSAQLKRLSSAFEGYACRASCKEFFNDDNRRAAKKAFPFFRLAHLTLCLDLLVGLALVAILLACPRMGQC